MRITDTLGGLAGTWSGMAGFRLMPTDELASAESTATIAIVAGNGLTFSYDWVHPADGPQNGYLFMFDTEDGQAGGIWLDTWHQQPSPMRLDGEASANGIRLDATYGPGTDWTIILGQSSDTELTMSMQNHVAPHAPYDTMESRYRMM